MPVYTFSLSDGRSAIRAEAIELADAAMARKAAAAYARDLAPAARRAWREVVVTDAAGQEVLTVLLPASPRPVAGNRRALPPKSHRRLLEQRRRRA